MNLAIDVGNTSVKLGVFRNTILHHKETCALDNFLSAIHKLFNEFPTIQHCIISSVGKLSKNQVLKVTELCTVIELNHKTKISFINKYGTPATLGLDRIALISAASHQYYKQNVLVIDAGTCITYDFISDNNEYLGGAISPGIAQRYKSLNTFTANLPLLEKTNPATLTGNNTANSIHAGIINGVLFELNGFIKAYDKKYKNLTVILTGGDIHFLRDSIKNDIFANSNFLLEGLNHILEYNKH